MIKQVAVSSHKSERKDYTMSQTAVDQRKANGQHKRWISNLKALSEKLSLKADEFKLLDEITLYISQVFTFEQITGIFRQEFDECVASKLEIRLNDMNAINEDQVKSLESDISKAKAELQDVKTKLANAEIQLDTMKNEKHEVASKPDPGLQIQLDKAKKEIRDMKTKHTKELYKLRCKSNDSASSSTDPWSTSAMLEKKNHW